MIDMFDSLDLFTPNITPSVTPAAIARTATTVIIPPMISSLLFPDGKVLEYKV